jgi:galactonate dehydratase
VIHDAFAEVVLGRSALDIESIWDGAFSYCNFFGQAGAEMRAISAINIALWDLARQRTGQPIYNLLGGRVRDLIPIYNTCVNDQDDFLNRPAKLAKKPPFTRHQGNEDLAVGPIRPAFSVHVSGWPAGQLAMGPSGSFLPSRDLDTGLNVVKGSVALSATT